jgi:hypothetical protein
MLLRFSVFTDPIYTADKSVEFDPLDVVVVEQKQVSLFLRGSHWATYITLKNGAEHTLEGKVANQILDAQRQARRNQSA